MGSKERKGVPCEKWRGSTTTVSVNTGCEVRRTEARSSLGTREEDESDGDWWGQRRTHRSR
jgi:hypothetical protein